MTTTEPRYIVRYHDDDWSPGDELYDRIEDEVIMTDGWAVEAPEDATLARGYSTLVAEMNRLHQKWFDDCSLLLQACHVGSKEVQDEVDAIERNLRESQ